MKTIGLLGGMSWESTVLYYRYINELTKARRGGLHSAPIVLASVDFYDYEVLQRSGDWTESGRRLAAEAQRLESAGADCVVLCTNTMHRVAPEITAALSIPFLHIADATGDSIRLSGLSRIGLLGTAFTMEQAFYRDRLAERYDLEVIVPGDEDRAIVHRVIYEELVRGVISEPSRHEFVRITDELRSRGAEGVIAGCTEIGMLLDSTSTDVPLFDTTRIHAAAAVEWALSDL